MYWTKVPRSPLGSSAEKQSHLRQEDYATLQNYLFPVLLQSTIGIKMSLSTGWCWF